MSLPLSVQSVIFAGALGLVAVSTVACPAAQPRFPWHAHPAGRAEAPLGGLRVQTLTPPAPVPIEALPPKPSYPYGWFGSDAAHHWKRSFGVSRSYTQWSRY